MPGIGAGISNDDCERLHIHMKWQTKALIQRIASRIPAGEALYRFGQAYLSSYSRASGLKSFRVESRLYDALYMLSALDEVNEPISEKRTFEIGTGWCPVLPLTYWLSGHRTCDTYDVSRLVQRTLVIKAARQLVAVLTQPDRSYPGVEEWCRKTVDGTRVKRLEELLESGTSAGEIMTLCNIRYHAPVDAAATGLDDQSMDLLYSHSVLGHVPEDEVHRLCRESHRVIRPGGLAVHQIDMSDQFAQADSSISRINFLQFSRQEFSKYNTVFCFHNRMRAPAYRQILEEHGFEILVWKTIVDQNALKQLNSMRVHDDFSSFSPESLCATSLLTVVKRI